MVLRIGSEFSDFGQGRLRRMV